MRRQFNLPQHDVDYLDSQGFQWETLVESNLRWLIIHNYPVPKGYTVERTSVALNIDLHYPTTQIDMAYFNPSLDKVNGRGINAIAIQAIDGKQWQRWSRHRSSTPWLPGEDDVSTHLGMFDNILNQELLR